MLTVFSLTGALALFLFGIRLSAFFSGSETGFYRVSSLRLSIDVHAGDRLSEQILWFVRNPSYFIATTLVGNNVANYITTAAIGLVVAVVYHEGTGWVEIVATLFISPIIFVFGELVPKNLYFRSPLRLLRHDARWFVFFYRSFLFVSFPLIWIAKLFERFGTADDRQLELVLGRNRLVQVLSQGHREGLLRDVQNWLVEGLMHSATQLVTDATILTDRVLGCADDVSCEEVLDYAQRYGVTSVAIKQANSQEDWYGFVRVIDVAVHPKSLAAHIRNMPKIQSSATKLEALLELHSAQAVHGVVLKDEKILGVVSERGLVSQLFRAPQAVAVRFGSRG